MRLTIDATKGWRLSHILEGHTSDVKCVYASEIDEQVELLYSASRDETGRSWYRNSCHDPATFQRSGSYQGKRFQNSVVHVRTPSTQGNGTTLLGGLDARILAFETKSSYSDKPLSKVSQVLPDHYDNVCHLSVSSATAPTMQTLLISASWDGTSRVWKMEDEDGSWHLLHILKGHERAVWAAEIVSAVEGEERYLTASADLFVRFWHGQELKRVFAGHDDVVRAITLLPPQPASEEASMSAQLTPFYDREALFVTASNDGTLRVWSLDDRRCPKNNPTNGGDALRILKVDEGSDILYDVKFAGLLRDGNGRVVVSCGEDGVLRGWNVEDGKVVMSIPQPITSIWSLAVLPHSGDLVTANSDAKVRIFTQRPASTSQEQRENCIVEVTFSQLQEHEESCAERAGRIAK